jgi:hypothetical protein
MWMSEREHVRVLRNPTSELVYGLRGNALGIFLAQRFNESLPDRSVRPPGVRDAGPTDARSTFARWAVTIGIALSYSLGSVVTDTGDQGEARASRLAPRSELGKLRSFAAGSAADLRGRYGCRLVGLGGFRRESPLFPARSGALVVRAEPSTPCGLAITTHGADCTTKWQISFKDHASARRGRRRRAKKY